MSRLYSCEIVCKGDDCAGTALGIRSQSNKNNSCPAFPGMLMLSTISRLHAF